MSNTNILDFESITVSSVVIALTAAKYGKSGVNSILVTVETASVRFRVDGGDPSSAVGHLIDTGGKLLFSGDLSKVKFIRAAASDALIQVSYGSSIV